MVLFVWVVVMIIVMKLLVVIYMSVCNVESKY